jgi:N-acetylated-alpha-linked acidic dipeptidase
MSERQVDSARLWRDAEAISRWPREAGSQGEAAAFDHIAAQLEGHGIAFTRRHTPALISLPVRAELIVGGRAVKAITHSMAASTSADGLEASLVPARVAENEWRGRVVAFDGLAQPASVRRAQQAGALAALFLSFDRIAHEMIVSSVWGSPHAEEHKRLPGIPAATIGGVEAGELRDTLAAPGAMPTVRLSTEVTSGWREIPLLIADVRGPCMDEQFVLFSGHVDSWHLGAMDNAGANAVMLEVARLAQDRRERLRRHLRIAFWSGHSHGRYAGSAWYVDEHWEDLERNCVAHVNIDSVGARGATVLGHAQSMADTHRVGAQAIRAVTGEDLLHARFPRAGDQSLMNLGVSSLFLTLSEQPPGGESQLCDGSALLKGQGVHATGGLGWWWHTPEDTLDKLDPAVLSRDAEIYWQAIDAFTGETIVPLDVAATATELDEQLNAIAARCCGRFDLGRVLEQSARARRLAREAMRIAADLDGRPDDPAIERVNRTLLAASRPLTRVGHAAADRFGHDSADALPPVPLLAPLDALCDAPPGSAAEHMLRILAVRGRNEVLHELNLVEAALKRVLPELEQESLR